MYVCVGVIVWFCLSVSLRRLCQCDAIFASQVAATTLASSRASIENYKCDITNSA